jgi:hypothetical protein
VLGGEKGAGRCVFCVLSSLFLFPFSYFDSVS